MRRSAILGVAAATLALGLAGISFGEREYKQVDTTLLLENPQDYWALGVIFRETLLAAPAARRLRIAGDQYAEISAQTLGACYINENDLARLEGIELGQEYLCSGSVLQHRRQYYVIIEDLKPVVLREEETGDVLRRLLHDDYAETLNASERRAKKMLADAEQSLVVYMKENDLPDHRILLDTESEHHEAALEAIRASVASAESEYETTARELLTGFIFAALAENARAERAREESVSVDASPTNAPAPAAETDEPLDDILAELVAAVENGGAATNATPGATQLKITPEEWRQPAEPGPPAPEPEKKTEPPPTPPAEPKPVAPPAAKKAEPAAAKKPEPPPPKPAPPAPPPAPADDLNAPVAW